MTAREHPYWFLHKDLGGASYETLQQAQHAALDECEAYLTRNPAMTGSIGISVFKGNDSVSIVTLRDMTRTPL